MLKYVAAAVAAFALLSPLAGGVAAVQDNEQALAAGLGAARRPATESCESWGEGQKNWACAKDKCKHHKEADEVVKAMNVALGACLEKASFASKIPIVSGVVKSKCMDGIRAKIGQCHAKACADGSLTCLKNAAF